MKKLVISPFVSLFFLVLLGLTLLVLAQSSAAQDALTSAADGGPRVLRVPRRYATIQAAVNAARVGDTIRVAAGSYNENVVISTSGLRLNASRGAVIDGGGLTGTGIHVLGTAAQPVANVEISGFEVRGFQRGILLEFTTGARINWNDIHDNNQAPDGPTAGGQAAGIDLMNAKSSVVSENFVHKNGIAGILLRIGSTDNVVQANRIFENGALRMADMDMGGVGILVTGAGTDDNEIRSNEIHRNFGRGILISRPAGTVPISGNLVLKNRLRENQRCGVCIMFAAQDNVVLSNDATGNNLAGLEPCLTFNLFDNTQLGNVWKKNKGTSNF